MSDEPKIFTVRALADTLAVLPPDWEVWMRLDDVAGELTHIKIGSIKPMSDVKVILECCPDSATAGQGK
jgi:hypothetical protein